MTVNLRQLWTQYKVAATIVLLILCGAAVLGATRLMIRSPSVPTITVKREEFLDTLELGAAIKALKSVPISAPANAGDLQILKITADGTLVKKGDVIVQFDATKTQQDLAQFRSVLRSTQAEISHTKAQARMTEEADTTQMMKSRYDVERARLEASKEEIVSRIEGAESRLKLADAQQKLKESEQKLKADRSVDQATIESKIQASKKAAYDVDRASDALARMQLTAPISGMVSLTSVWRPGGEAVFKAGDHAWPGAPIAEIPDISTLRIATRVDETERGRLRTGQAVTVQFDAIPERQFTGHVEEISTLASTDFSGGWPFPRDFDLVARLDQSDSRLKPGMPAQLTIILDRVLNALVIPAQASFQKSGETVTYVWNRSRFEERVIEVRRRSGGQILVSHGLQPGDEVALIDPTAKE